jgi:hypothetical protein
VCGAEGDGEDKEQRFAPGRQPRYRWGLLRCVVFRCAQQLSAGPVRAVAMRMRVGVGDITGLYESNVALRKGEAAVVVFTEQVFNRR